MVSVSLFGQLSVRAGNQVLGPSSFPGVKPKALLELLLLARGRPVSKETLADALWPEERPKNVAATLETYVSIIRGRIFVDRPTARRVIVTSAGAYRIDETQIDLDVTNFDALLARADQAPPSQRRALWTAAIALARGQLLEDEPNASWAAAPRELYRDRVIRTHLQIAQDALRTAEPALALGHSEAAVACNPLAEEAHRMVMLANHALGYGEAARQAFLRCRDLLDIELDVDPTTATTQLAAAIDAGVPAAELIETTTGVVPVVVRDEPRDRRHPTRRMTFLGRAAELSRLHACAAAAREGAMRLALVESDPGFGRTALLEQFRQGSRVPTGRYAYQPGHAELPSLPLAGALCAALAGTDGMEDAHRYGAAPSLGLPGEDRGALLALLTEHAPLILLLDDVHHADEDTFEVLQWLRRVAPTLALTVVASARTGSLGSARLEALGPDEHLILGGLSPAECTEARSIDPGLVALTGGHPAMVSDLWRWRRSGRSDLPPSLEDRIRRRVRGLGAPLASLLWAAASCPRNFELGQLGAVTGVAEPALVEQLRRLCALGFIETDGTGFRFVQPVVRDVLVATAGPPSAAPRLAAPPRPVRAQPWGTAGARPAVNAAAPELAASLVARRGAPVHPPR